jgi:hypothetical protein
MLPLARYLHSHCIDEGLSVRKPLSSDLGCSKAPGRTPVRRAELNAAALDGTVVSSSNWRASSGAIKIMEPFEP